MANVLVTGGTGELGRLVVAQLLAHQHTPRVLSRQTHLDLPEGAESVYGELTSGTGLREAVKGVDAIIHCASSPQEALATDIGGTRMLVHAAREAGSPHFIYVSIVGIDHAQSGYYQAKYEAERIVMQSPLPWSIVRATQFHSLALRLIQSLGIEMLNVIPVPPNVRLQTIATGEVAERLLALAEGGKTGQVEDMGGPQVLTLEEMIQTYLHVRGREVSMRAVDLPNSLFATFSSSEHQHAAPAVGKQTWEEFMRSWCHERDSYHVPDTRNPVLLEKTVQAHDPVQVSIIEVSMEPGSYVTPPHRHPGPIFGYVAEGSVLFEMRGHPPTIYRQGDTFYESSECIHLLANNPSPSGKTVLVAVLLGEPGQPILTPIQLQAGTNDPVDGSHSSCS